MWGLDAPNQLAVIPATFKRISFSVWFDKKSKACSTQRDSDHHILLVNLGRNDTKAVQASDAVGVFREQSVISLVENFDLIAPLDVLPVHIQSIGGKEIAQ